MTCPRAKKAKKADHKLRYIGTPGFTVILTPPDHEYRLALNSIRNWLPEERLLLREGWRWYDLPSNMRYADCACGMPWMDHQPGFEGTARYLGRWEVGPRLVSAARGTLISCSQCGIVGAE